MQFNMIVGEVTCNSSQNDWQNGRMSLKMFSNSRTAVLSIINGYTCFSLSGGLY